MNESNSKAELDFEKGVVSVEFGPSKEIQEGHVVGLTP